MLAGDGGARISRGRRQLLMQLFNLAGKKAFLQRLRAQLRELNVDGANKNDDDDTGDENNGTLIVSVAATNDEARGIFTSTLRFRLYNLRRGEKNNCEIAPFR